jgi:hypothetical protein
MNKEVYEYIEKQKSTQKEILIKLRKLIIKTLPTCEEKMSWGVPVFADGKFYIVALKNHVNFGFAINGLDKNETDLFEGKGKTMRHKEFHSLEDIDEKYLAKLIKMVYKKAVCKSC